MRRVAIVAGVVAGALATNLLLYVIGRAAGGTFVYTHPSPTTVDAASIVIMTAGPLAVGLGLLAWLSARWPVLLTFAPAVVAVPAIATIGLMTIPAHFDTTSTVFLSAMHVILIPMTLLAALLLRQLNQPGGGEVGGLRGRDATEEVIGAGHGHV